MINFIPSAVPPPIIKNRSKNHEYNKDGFRMKPFEEIDENNYALFLGCSNTEGQGVALRHTYPYKVCAYLNVDCVNLGAGSLSNNYMEILLQDWLVVNKPPKFIVINWSGVSRYVYTINGETQNYGPWMINSRKNLPEYYLDWLNTSHDDMIKATENIVKRVTKVCEINNIKLFNITNFDYKIKGLVNFKSVDCGNDGIHPGPKTNHLIYKFLLKD